MSMGNDDWRRRPFERRPSRNIGSHRRWPTAPPLWLPLVAAAGLALAGCSFTTLDVGECEASTECRSAFGFGYVCTEEGLCEEAEPSPRCTETFPPGLWDNRLEHRDRIVFGNIVDQSVGLFQAFENSAALAYEQANTRGGVDGREFGAVFCSVEENADLDDLDHVQAAVASVQFLAQTAGVPAILGPVTSVEVQDSFLAMADEDVLMISPSATSPALTDLDPADVSNSSPGRLWRTAASDALQGTAIARDMLTVQDPPVTSVAAIHEVGAYGEGLYEAFARDFRDGGGNPMEFPYEDAGALSEVLAQVGSSDVQQVLFISSDTPTIVGFLESTSNLAEFDDKLLFMPDTAANPDVLTVASELALAKVRGTRPAPLDEAEDVYASFIAAYAAEFSEDVRSFPYTPNVFDAAWLLNYGAAWALLGEDGEVTGTNIARGLRRLSNGQSVEIRPSGWTAVLQEFREGNGVDVQGASGELDFDPDTEETSASIEIWQVVDRNISSIYTVNPAE
jgi:ABC-type branched-subunit amino acid transport system substrate-binding protein